MDRGNFTPDAVQELIEASEAARRLASAAGQPGRDSCGTCRFFHPNRTGGQGGECWQPRQPMHVEHALSVRCDHYEWRDERAEAMPVNHTSGKTSRMWK